MTILTKGRNFIYLGVTYTAATQYTLATAALEAATAAYDAVKAKTDALKQAAQSVLA